MTDVITAHISDLAAACEAAVCRRMAGRRDTCVLTTAVFLQALKTLAPEFQAFPLAVTLSIYNPVMRRLAETRQPLPEGDAAQDAIGGWSVGVGHKTPERPDACHLVALIKPDVIVDPTIMQASRPEKGITITAPLTGTVTEAFLTARGPVIFDLAGCHIVYRAKPADLRYLTDRQFRNRRLVRELAEEASARLVTAVGGR